MAAKAAPRCGTCSRSAQQLQGMPERWECTHIACPLRKPLTAAPPAQALRLASDGCWRQSFTPDE